MTISRNAGRRFLVMCLMTGVATDGLAAQENKEQPPQNEIVVTAQLREQSLQDVPISIDVLGADEIAQKKIDDIGDIGNEVPGLSVYSFVPRQVNPSIRGAGSLNDSPGVDQAVAISLDGVYIGQTGFFSFDLFDIERIEVLKGPQGTLFGRNVTGGALNITTTTPPDSFDAIVEATLGNYGRREFQGVVGGPLADSLAGQIAFSSKNTNGFYKNTVDGDDIEAQDTFSLRGKLKYDLGDAAEIILSAEYARDQVDGIGFDTTGDPFPGQSTESFDANRLVSLDTPGGVDNELRAFTGTVNLDTGAGTITSITAYRKANNYSEYDIDGTSVAELVGADGDNIKQFSQELRLTGEVGNLQYVGGLYYLNINHDRTEDRTLNGISLVSQIQDIETKSYAAYAEFTYDFGALSLTGGVRYTKDKKSGSSACTADPFAVGFFCPAVSLTVPHKDSWDAVTPRFVAQYEVNGDVMVYGSFSRGFKSGGFPLNFDPNGFDPEFANNYEVGLKSRLFDRRLQANIALFQLDFTDLQVLSQTPGGVIRAANAGEARTRGVEVDLNAQVSDAFNLFANYSYLDAEFKSLVIEGTDFSGNNPRATPKHSLNVGGSYTWDLDNGGAFSMRASMLYRSRYFLNVDNLPDLTAKVGGLINAGAEYTTPDEHWNISVWVKNLTDERFFATKADRGQFFGATGTTYTGRYNEPRTFGATVRWSY